MSALQRAVNWLDAYREVAFDLMRIYLGVGLFVRGVLFLYDPEAYRTLLPEAAAPMLGADALVYLVALVHLAGGALMAVGLWTRLAALVQIPILLGAVVFSFGGLFSANQSFEFSSLVLFLLALVLIYGSGRWSVDHYWRRKVSTFREKLEGLYQYRERAFDLLRIYLGVGLFVRGVIFFSDTSAFMELLADTPSPWLASSILIHYVALAHLVGGAMMAAGLLTRLAALVQIPILIGAVFVVHFQGGLLAPSQSFEFSVLVLFLLLVVFLYGSGLWSADYYLFVRKIEVPEETEVTPRAREILDREIPEEEEEPLGVPGGVLTAEPEVAAGTRRLTRNHPLVVAEARYSTWGWLLFLVDVTPRPREIVFRHIKTGEIVERSRDPKVLDDHRYR